MNRKSKALLFFIHRKALSDSAIMHITVVRLMLLRQIQYYIAVVDHKSFTEAADACHISQSAISQQIKALEDELGFELLVRKNRSFELTPAGKYFYENSAGILKQVQKVCEESRKIALDEKASIRLGYLKNYGGHEFQMAIAQFAKKYPNVDIHIFAGTHEELYERLVDESVDLVLNDQRRAFSDVYNNLVLTEQKCFIEVPSGSFYSSLERITVEELNESACILVTSAGQEETDKEFYRDILGFSGQYVISYSLEEARMLMLAGKGYLPIEGNFDRMPSSVITRVPLFRKDQQAYRRYCAFWKQDNSGYYIEEFADILEKHFQSNTN